MEIVSYKKYNSMRNNLAVVWLAKVLESSNPKKNLKVMDASAIALARDNGLPIIVFSLDQKGGLQGILTGQGTCTKVSETAA